MNEPKPMTASEMGKLGGKSRSAKKMAAVTANLEQGRRKLGDRFCKVCGTKILEVEGVLTHAKPLDEMEQHAAEYCKQRAKRV